MRRLHPDLASAALAAALAGCAGGAHLVRLSRPAYAGPEEARRAAALRSLYVAVEDSAPGRDLPLSGLLEPLAKRSLEEREPRADAAELASAVAAALAKAGAGRAAFRVARPGERDPWPERLGPAAVLRLKPLPVAAVKRKTVQKLEQKDPKDPSRTVTKETVSHTLELRLEVEARLEEWPGRAGPEPGLLAARHESVSMARAAKPGEEPGAWFKKVERELIEQVAAKLAASIVPATRVLLRPVYARAGDPASESALREAREGRWAAAEAAWRGRADHGGGDWRDQWNLAVAAERSGDLPEARRRYEGARAAAAQAPELKRVGWDRLLAELSSLPEAPRALAREPFAPRVAVLPFADETTSVDGPVLARRAVHGLLAEGGYAVLPLEEVDEALRRKGFTQGGQLKAATERRLCEWLYADRLLYGNIELYQSLPARVVAGELWLWDKASGRKSWTARSYAVNESASASDSADLRRLTGEKWSGLLWLPSAEMLRFARRALGSLPRLAREE